MKKLSLIVTLSLLLCLAAGCGGSGQVADGGQAAAPEAGGGGSDGGQAASVSFKIGGGPSGSTNYVVASGLASLLSTNYDGYIVSGEITIGTQENIRMLQSGEYQMALAMMDSVVMAYQGEREYEPEQKELLSLVMCGNSTVLHLMVPADSDIESFPDLAGKRVGVSSGVMSQFYFPMLLEAYGMSEEDVRSTNLALQDMCDGMADGTFDAIFHVVGVGSGPIADLAVTKGIRFLELGDDVCASIRETEPYWDVDVIPAGSYNGIDRDVQTLSTTIALVARPDFSQEVVYNTLKLILENPDDFAAIHPIAGEYNADNALKSVLIPLHPGAEQYYREAGMI